MVDFCLYIYVNACTCASVLHMNMNTYTDTSNKTNAKPPNSLSVIRFTETFVLKRGKSYNPTRLPITSGKITIKDNEFHIFWSCTWPTAIRNKYLAGQMEGCGWHFTPNWTPSLLFLFLMKSEMRWFKTMIFNSYTEQDLCQSWLLLRLLCNPSCNFDDTGRETVNLSHTWVMSSLDVHPESGLQGQCRWQEKQGLSL